MAKRSTGVGTAVLIRTLVIAIALMPVPGLQADTRNDRHAAAALSIASDPPGAAVYVDGRFEGQTPINVPVAPGDHRVRLVKSGFLENARVVNVTAGQSGNVLVRLTRPAGGEVAAAEQVTGGGGGGGGSKKWLWIGLAGAGAAAAAFLLMGGNKPPSAGTASVSPTGTGMAGLTSFSFNSSASDPDGDSLTYNWNFGDGSTGTGATPTKTYNNPGTFQVTVTVSDGKESATSAPASVTVAQNLSGTWSGGTVPSLNCAAALALTHNASGLSGSMNLVSNCQGSIALASATASTPLVHPNTVTVQTNTFNFTSGSQVFPNLQVRFSGPTNANGTSMTGTITIIQNGVAVSSQTTTFSR